MFFFQVVDIGFFNQRKTTQDNYDTDAMAKEFLMQFTKQCFTVGQPIVFQFKSMPLTQVLIKDIEVTDLNALQQGREAKPLKVSSPYTIFRSFSEIRLLRLPFDIVWLKLEKNVY